MRLNGPKFDPSNPQKYMKDMKKDPFASMNQKTGGSMMFVELKSKKKGGGVYSRDDMDKLAATWSSMLRAGSLSANVYNLGQDGNKKNAHTLLLNVDKGWMTGDVLKFALTRKETKKVTIDQKDYLPKDYKHLLDDDDDDDDDEL
jgi:hypothetical protein